MLRNIILLVPFFILSFSVQALAEQTCDQIKAKLNEMYAEPLECTRKKCPAFRITEAGTPEADECLKGCESESAGQMPEFFEPDLQRCSSSFVTADEQDFFLIAWCMSASYSVAKVVEPFMLCTRRDACTNKDVWNTPPCLKQCEEDAKQLVEASASTLERCSGLPQSKRALCTMVQRAINVCFIPEHCNRLETVVKRECPELLVTPASAASR